MPVRLLLLVPMLRVVRLRPAVRVMRGSLVHLLRVAAPDRRMSRVVGHGRRFVLHGRDVPGDLVLRPRFRVLDVYGSAVRGGRGVSRGNDDGATGSPSCVFCVVSRRVVFRDRPRLRLRVHAAAGRSGGSRDGEDGGVVRPQQNRRQDDRHDERSRERDGDAGRGGKSIAMGQAFLPVLHPAGDAGRPESTLVATARRPVFSRGLTRAM